MENRNELEQLKKADTLLQELEKIRKTVKSRYSLVTCVTEHSQLKKSMKFSDLADKAVNNGYVRDTHTTYYNQYGGIVGEERGFGASNLKSFSGNMNFLYNLFTNTLNMDIDAYKLFPTLDEWKQIFMKFIPAVVIFLIAGAMVLIMPNDTGMGLGALVGLADIVYLCWVLVWMNHLLKERLHENDRRYTELLGELCEFEWVHTMPVKKVTSKNMQKMVGWFEKGNVASIEEAIKRV